KLKLNPYGVFRGSGSTIVNGITDIEGTIVNSGPFINTSLILNDTVNFTAKELKSHPSYPLGNVIINGYLNWNNGGNIKELNLTVQNGFTKLGISNGVIQGTGIFTFNGNYININEGTFTFQKSLQNYNGSISILPGRTLTIASTGSFGGNI